MKKNKKKIIITGCNGSIGSALVSFFIKKKFIVIGLDKTKPAMKKVIFYTVNLSNISNLNKTYKKIYKKYNSVDYLINCAGFIHNELLIKYQNGFKTHSISNWKKVIENNLNTTFYNTKMFVDYFSTIKKNDQVIINFSSVNSEGLVGQSSYGAAKAAIEVATKVWSKELSVFKIRVACISPGYINVKSTNQNITKTEKEKITNAIPLKRFGNINEIISGINFIINNRYFNGKTLKIDGGK